MGLAQLINFKSSNEDIIDVLMRLDYKSTDKINFYKKNYEMTVEIKIIETGIYIHRSGEYFKEIGMLIEAIGNIASELTISDYP